MNYSQITQAVKAALTHRDSRRDVLAGKIEEVAAEALTASRRRKIEIVPAVGHLITIEREVVRAACSQWADGSRAVTARDEILTLTIHGSTRSLGPVDLSYFDGRNMQRQQPKYPRLDGTGETVRPATVAQLREVARLLPEAVSQLLAEAQRQAEAEARDADETIAALG